jgi:hypothetical protein
MNTLLRSWQPIAALALLYFGINPALRYGGIWELQVHPISGVTVKLHDGREVQGELTRVWSGDWMLTAANGPSIQFDDHSYQWLEFTRPRQPPSFASMWVKKWREHLLFFLVIGLAGGLLLSGITKSLRPGAHPELAE